MDTKKFFGTILTILGIGALIYTAVLFMNTAGGTRDIKALTIYGILGIIFFFSGISLVRTINGES